MNGNTFGLNGHKVLPRYIITSPNIYLPRHLKNPINDWYLAKLRCRQASFHEPLEFLAARVRRAVKDKTGTDPYVDKRLRPREKAMSRHLFFYFVRKKGVDKNGKKFSLEKIGMLLGKDHATVLNSCKAVENAYDTDKVFRVLCDDINFALR